MASIPTIVDNYVLGIIADLKQGDALDLLSPHQVYMSGKNFQKAADLSAAMDLLQQTLNTGTLTIVTGAGNTVRSLTNSAATFVANQQIGNYVTFTNGNLNGQVRRIVSNTTTVLTLAGPDLSEAPFVTTTTYKITGGIWNDQVLALRENKGIGASPSGEIYGDARMVEDGFSKFITQLSGTIVNQPITTVPKVGTGSTTTVVVVDTVGLGEKLRIDRFKNMSITIGSDTCRILRNDETTITLVTPLSSAPAATTAMTIFVPAISSEPFSNTVPHVGGQPGDNAQLAQLLTAARAAVVAYTVPT